MVDATAWRRTRRPARLGLALVAAAALTAAGGCTDASEPRFQVDDLRAGPCRDMGAALLEVERTQRELTAGQAQAAPAAGGYAEAQARLRDVGEAAEPAVAEPARELRTAIGLFRVGVDAGTLTEEEGEAVRTALDDVLRACGVDVS
jgi:hypothetical protein